MDKLLLLDKPTYQAWTTSLATLQKRMDLIYQVLEQETQKTTSEGSVTQNKENKNVDPTDVLNQVLQTVNEMTSLQE